MTLATISEERSVSRLVSPRIQTFRGTVLQAVGLRPIGNGGTPVLSARYTSRSATVCRNDRPHWRGSLRIGSRGSMPDRYLARMTARSPHEPHRASTPLELFFDLVFVVAIAQAAGGLHHAIAEAHVVEALFGYLMVFFAIWWAWMNFTWFASAYDCDDLPYRLAVFVQITGALIMAAGVPAMFESADTQPRDGRRLRRDAAGRRRAVAACRALRSRTRATARRYALGVAVLQVAWVAMLAVPHLWVRGSSRLPCSRSSCRCGPSGPDKPRGIRITSPSDTGC